MLASPIPVDDKARLSELYSYGILDSAQSADYDGIVELAAFICQCPMAVISFIDEDREWFKARKNIPDQEALRSDSFCGHTIMNEDVMVVNDANKDDRFFDNPFVTGDLKIKFYAGAPIISSSGHKLGTVCALDSKPGELSAEQKKALQILAHQVTKLLELRKRNNELIFKSEAILLSEKKIARLNAEEREAENTLIATELHEDFAQVLATIKMYIEFAQGSKDLTDVFLEKSKNEIALVIGKVLALSKTITPTTHENANYTLFIEEMVEEYARENNIEIAFDIMHDDRFNAAIGLALYRIIQYQLKYASFSGAKEISLRLYADNEIQLQMLHDGTSIANGQERLMLISNSVTRAEILKGHFKQAVNAEGLAEVLVSLPF